MFIIDNKEWNISTQDAKRQNVRTQSMVKNSTTKRSFLMKQRFNKIQLEEIAAARGSHLSPLKNLFHIAKLEDLVVDTDTKS